jgi:hypothetical protein
MFKCPECCYISDRRYNLNIHIKRKHQTCQKQSENSSVINFQENVIKNDYKNTNLKGFVIVFDDQNRPFQDSVIYRNFSNLEIPKKFAKKNGKIAKNAENGKFVCENCKKEYKTKSYYDNHISTCCIKIDKANQCPHCRKCLSSRQSKSRHLKICQTKEAKLFIEEQEIRNPIPIEIQNENKNVINNFTYHIHNAKPINRPGKYIDYNSSDDEEYADIQRNNFGKETTDYISREMLDTLTEQFNVKKLIELKHFNPDHPENHNIRKNTNKSVKVFIDNKWKVYPKQDIFEQIFNRCRQQLFTVFLDHLLTDKHNLSEQETEELMQRWKDYEVKHAKKIIDFIDIQFEELIKQRQKIKSKIHENCKKDLTQ